MNNAYWTHGLYITLARIVAEARWLSDQRVGFRICRSQVQIAAKPLLVDA